VAFADRLTFELRVSDTAARLGGDEFAVVLEDCQPADVRGLVERLRQALAAPLRLEVAAVPLSFSVGIGHAPSGTAAQAAFQRLMLEADGRMYADKGRRRRS
jgi:diguanylate cyclase (GGDEF)-like protein